VVKLKRKKEIYEDLYPETKAGTIRAMGMHTALGHVSAPGVATYEHKTFSEDTAAKAGISSSIPSKRYNHLK
jgi:hypothetical protein